MVRCPNCGRRTSGDYCQWCNYPILRGSRRRALKAKRQAQRQAELAAREKAKQEAEEAKKAREAEKLAEKARKAAEAEEYLKQADIIVEELNAEKTGTEEALKRLQDIYNKIGK